MSTGLSLTLVPQLSSPLRTDLSAAAVAQGAHGLWLQFPHRGLFSLPCRGDKNKASAASQCDSRRGALSGDF